MDKVVILASYYSGKVISRGIHQIFQLGRQTRIVLRKIASKRKSIKRPSYKASHKSIKRQSYKASKHKSIKESKYFRPKTNEKTHDAGGI